MVWFVRISIVFVITAGQVAPGESATQNDRLLALRNAWSILKAGTAERSSEKRAEAVSVLGLIPNDPKAADMAEAALHDQSPPVVTAAVQALGEMNDRAALPKIKALMQSADAKSIVVIAAVLQKFHDPQAFSIYYQILTGTRKTGGGILGGLKDRKNLEKMGVAEAIGLIPYSGIATGAYNYFKENNSSNLTVDATAAAALASDPDPASEKALVQACFGRKEAIEIAALRALAKRGDPAVIDQIAPSMYDGKPLVNYTAAATVVHLTEVPRRKHS